jgi:hypothetical protein
VWSGVLLLLALLVGTAGRAQPMLGETTLVVRLLTPEGRTLPVPADFGIQLLTQGKAFLAGVRYMKSADACTYSLNGMAAGRYVVRVTSASYGFLIEQPVECPMGTTWLDVRCPVHALDVQWVKDGKPVVPRTLHLFCTPVKQFGTAVEPVDPRLVSTADSTTVIDAVPAGDICLTVFTDLGAAVVRMSVPTQTARVTQKVALAPGGVCDLTVQSPSGKPLPGAQVQLTLAGDNRVVLPANDAGKVTGVQVPVGVVQCALAPAWLARQGIPARASSAVVASVAGQPVAATLRVLGRQTFTARVLLAGKPVTPQVLRLSYVYLPDRPYLQPLACTWQGDYLQAVGFFPEANRMWLFTELGYARLEFSWPGDRDTLTQTFTLQADGGTIVVKTDPAARYCSLTGMLAGTVASTIDLTLTQEKPGTWRSPQLPPGEWNVRTVGAKPLRKSVTLKAGQTVEIAL